MTNKDKYLKDNVDIEELKKVQGEYKKFLITALNVLRLNSKITDKEYTKIRDRILGGKEVAN